MAGGNVPPPAKNPSGAKVSRAPVNPHTARARRVPIPEAKGLKEVRGDSTETTAPVQGDLEDIIRVLTDTLKETLEAPRGAGPHLEERTLPPSQ